MPSSAVKQEGMLLTATWSLKGTVSSNLFMSLGISGCSDYVYKDTRFWFREDMKIMRKLTTWRRILHQAVILLQHYETAWFCFWRKPDLFSNFKNFKQFKLMESLGWGMQLQVTVMFWFLLITTHKQIFKRIFLVIFHRSNSTYRMVGENSN